MMNISFLKLHHTLSIAYKILRGTTVIQQLVRRSPRSVIHILPGSYKYTVRGSTSFPNLFIAGDWIVNRHGSFSMEKAYMTGHEAANRVVDYFGEGDFVKIIAVEGDEPHIEILHNLNRRANELRTQIPFLKSYFSNDMIVIFLDHDQCCCHTTQYIKVQPILTSFAFFIYLFH